MRLILFLILLLLASLARTAEYPEDVQVLDKQQIHISWDDMSSEKFPDVFYWLLMDGVEVEGSGTRNTYLNAWIPSILARQVIELSAQTVAGAGKESTLSVIRIVYDPPLPNAPENMYVCGG
jgi:hypothetical protein